MSEGCLSRRAAAPAHVAIAAASAATVVAGARGALDAVASRPAQPLIRPVAPFAPGGAAGLAARLVAQRSGERLKRPFFVENRPGAGAALGSAAAPAMRDRLAEGGGRTHALSPKEHTALVRSEAARWEPLARASGAAVG